MTENQRIKIIREELALDQLQFAGHLEMKQGSISDVERGKNGVSPKLINRIVEAFGANRNYIVNGTGPIFINKTIPTKPKVFISHKEEDDSKRLIAALKKELLEEKVQNLQEKVKVLESQMLGVQENIIKLMKSNQKVKR